MHSQQFRRVDHTCVASDRCCGFTLFTQILNLRVVRIIVCHMKHSHSLAAPFLVEPCHDGGLGGLVAAMVANKANGLEAGQLETARNTLQVGEHRLRNTERPRK